MRGMRTDRNSPAGSTKAEIAYRSHLYDVEGWGAPGGGINMRRPFKIEQSWHGGRVWKTPAQPPAVLCHHFCFQGRNGCGSAGKTFRTILWRVGLAQAICWTLRIAWSIWRPKGHSCRTPVLNQRGTPEVPTQVCLVLTRWSYTPGFGSVFLSGQLTGTAFGQCRGNQSNRWFCVSWSDARRWEGGDNETLIGPNLRRRGVGEVSSTTEIRVICERRIDRRKSWPN